MKTPSKQEHQQIYLNYSSDIDFKDSLNLYKKCTTRPYSLLVNDATIASDNTLLFRKKLLEKI